MYLTQKNKNVFQYKKLKNDLMSRQLILIGVLIKQGDTTVWAGLKRKLDSLGLCGGKANNTPLKKLLTNSIFRKQSALISGPIIVLIVKKKDIILKKLVETLKPEIAIIGLKLGNKLMPYTFDGGFRLGNHTDNKRKTLRNFNQSTKTLTKLLYLKSK